MFEDRSILHFQVSVPSIVALQSRTIMNVSRRIITVRSRPGRRTASSRSPTCSSLPCQPSAAENPDTFGVSPCALGPDVAGRLWDVSWGCSPAERRSPSGAMSDG
jgi:hypothetical protein